MAEAETAPDRLDSLGTEQARPELADLDLRPTLDLVRLMNAEDAAAAGAVAAAAPAVAAAIDAITTRLAAGGRLIYLGAGSAGRIAALDAAECAPTFGVDAGLVLACVAGAPSLGASSVATESAEDDAAAGCADLRAVNLAPADAVVGVSASGRTPYVLGGVALARVMGCLTVGVTSNTGTDLSRAVDHAIEVLTGPEVIAGSTRLKAGTVQKIVVNTISTLVMVRLGHTYGNHMVGVRTDNEKLRRRALRILVEVAGVPEAVAREAVDASGGQTRVALVMLMAGCSAADARARLAAARGRVREALDQPPPPFRASQ
jgi:N-acetylmuramic acid 6-phosphate etherase